ncbi:MAG: [FeFe] hydrogenase, group A [Actinomycetia bacterium]|nr:[FeFe] hydrogenase, group A [Actinomycetes bacterium]
MVKQDTSFLTGSTDASSSGAQVNLTINGIAVSAYRNMTILAAANKAGIKIPTLCFFWNLNDIGSCRVCAVEVDGFEQLVSACNNLVQDGMVIQTNSAKARQARRLNVELLLSQHDVQCSSCVRGGNCELRQLANDLNIIDVRFEKQTESFDWPEDYPLIREASKCIKCLRCIQICDNIQASHIWDLRNRATRSSVGVRDATPIKSSLCAVCGQCINHCPVGALRERDDTDRVLAAINDPEKITVVQVAPSVRTSWYEDFGLTFDAAKPQRLVAALRQVGFNYIFDTDFSADLTIMEEGSELLARVGAADKHPWPMFTSCCPGWVRWLKGHHPEMIDNLSTAKSPQQMFGAVTKSYYADVLGVDPKRIFSVSIMPCLAKKHECAIPNMNDACGDPDVDIALTVREMNRLIRSTFIDVPGLVDEEFDSPLGIGTGAGEIFGATGGVMEAALRSAYFLATGSNPDPDAFADVRGLQGWKEATFDLNGAPVRVAIASGLGNAEKLIAAIKAGEVHYDFVEIMACPGGCIAGGGQPIPGKLNFRTTRSNVLYGLDQQNQYRFSHENPSITKVYSEYFGAPLSERSHHLLHTNHRLWSMPNEDEQ